MKPPRRGFDLSRWLPPVRTLLLPLVQPDGQPLEPLVRPGQQVARFEPLARPPLAGRRVGCDLVAPCEARVLGLTPVMTSGHGALGSPNAMYRVWGPLPGLELRCETQFDPSLALGAHSLSPPAGGPPDGAALRELCRLRGLVDLSSGEPLARSIDRVLAYGLRHLVVNALDPLPEAAWHAELLHLASGTLARAVALLADLLVGRAASPSAPSSRSGLRRGPAVTLVLDRRSPAALGRAFRSIRNLRLARLENRYLMGHPRVLAVRLFGDRFPYDEPLTRHGVWVLDVETLFALAEALTEGEAFVWRWVYVGGDALEKPGLYRVFFGSRLGDLAAGVGVLSQVKRAVVGGLLAGQPVRSPDAVVTWQTGAVHFFSGPSARSPEPGPCVRCGWCVEACPVALDPRAIYGRVELSTRGQVAVPEDLHPGACIECGLCTYVCPAELDLMRGVTMAKRAWWARESAARAESAPR